MLHLQLRLLLIALRTWSRLAGPMRPGPAGCDPAWDARSARHAPLVGMLISLYATLAYVLAAGWFPNSIALLAGIATALLASAARHERGLAALFDGFATTAGARLGAAGAVALFAILMTRLESLSALDPSWIGVTLLCGAAFSRGCAVLVMGSLPAARAQNAPGADGALAVREASMPPQRPSGWDLLIAAAWSVLPLLGAIAWTGEDHVFASAAGCALVAAALVRRRARRLFGEHTESCFGGVQQFAELAFQLGILATLAIADETLADPSS